MKTTSKKQTKAPTPEPAKAKQQLVTLSHSIADIQAIEMSDGKYELATIITDAALLAEVRDNNQLAKCTSVRGLLKDFRLRATKEKKELLEPFKTITTKVSAVFQGILDKVEPEESRLASLANSYGLELERERERQREKLRKEEAERNKAIVDAQRKLEQAEAAQAEAIASGDIEGADRLNDKIAQQAFAVESLSEPIETKQDEPAIKVRAKMNYRVLGRDDRERDANVRAFAKAFPTLVKVEIRHSLLLAALETGLVNEDNAIGIEVFTEHVSHAKRITSNPAIEV